MTGTVSLADLYGGSPPGARRGDVQPSAAQTASGKSGAETVSQKMPVAYWLAFIALLVGARLAWEFGGSNG
jgi:hypothetical protein